MVLEGSLLMYQAGLTLISPATLNVQATGVGPVTSSAMATTLIIRVSAKLERGCHCMTAPSPLPAGTLTLQGGESMHSRQRRQHSSTIQKGPHGCR